MSRRRVAPADGLYVVGVTGGIASGKSTFVRILAQAMPSVVIDADRLGHGIVDEPAIAARLAQAFGDDVRVEGRIQRGVLGPRAFATPERLATLNRIVQGPLTERVEQALAHEAARGFAGLAILDAALLVEWDKGAWCDFVVAVVADPRRRIERLVARTGLARAEAERRVAAQLEDGVRAAYADATLENEGSLEAFEEACRACARAVEARARAVLAARRPTG